MEEMPLVLITGITGYLGSHVTLQALRSGKYRVRGSVRNKDDPKKKEFLEGMFQEELANMELVNVDLLNPESLKKAVEGTHKKKLICRMRPRNSCGFAFHFGWSQ